jgi:hypothetical protein
MSVTAGSPVGVAVATAVGVVVGRVSRALAGWLLAVGITVVAALGVVWYRVFYPTPEAAASADGPKSEVREQARTEATEVATEAAADLLRQQLGTLAATPAVWGFGAGLVLGLTRAWRLPGRLREPAGRE